jgi:hypothetical protein
VAFRADAAFAKPEIYDTLEAWDVDYAIRIPANESLEPGNCRIAVPTARQTQPEAAGSVQELFVSGGELDQGAADRRESCAHLPPFDSGIEDLIMSDRDDEEFRVKPGWEA